MTRYVQRRPATAFLSEELPILPQKLMLTLISQAGLVLGLGGLWCCSASQPLPAALLLLSSAISPSSKLQTGCQLYPGHQQQENADQSLRKFR